MDGDVSTKCYFMKLIKMNQLPVKVLGTTMAINTLGPKTQTRSYTATAYFLPNKDKSNFKVLCDAFVCRIVLEKEVGGEVIATGVEFEYEDNKYVVKARKEVVLSAGSVVLTSLLHCSHFRQRALNSPQLLELSGIGSAPHLRKLGIDVLVDLPSVGENLQEHLFSSTVYELDPSREWNTPETLLDPEYSAEQMRLQYVKISVVRYPVLICW